MLSTLLDTLDHALSWFVGRAPLVTAIAAVIGATIAILGYRKWHPESVGKRKIELAEDILADFYRAEEVIRWARFPGGLAGEGGTRQAPERETPHDKELRDAIYRTIERLQNEKELFSGLLAKKYRAMAYFGQGATKPFTDLKEIHDRIFRGAILLVRPRDELPPQALRDEWETAIGWRSMSDNDDIAKEVRDVVENVEAFYGRWLMRKSS